MPDTYVIDVKREVSAEELKLRRELISHIVHSKSFRGAQMLQHLLIYLAEKGLENEDEGALKEYSIGVHALGRKQDFDPKVDPIVRVQMHRLRQKLKEYYASEGAADSLILEIPKGNYLLSFTSPKLQESAENVAADETRKHTEDDAPVLAALHSSRHAGRKWSLNRGLLLVSLSFLLGALSVLFWTRLKKNPAAELQSRHQQADSVQRFWKQFLGNDTSPIIGYPDAVFLLDGSNDLFRFRQGATDQRGSLVNPDIVLKYASNPDLASKAGPLYYENGYTGTGELQAVAMLSALFAHMGITPTIKNSRDITTSDLAQHAVILLGSPFQNRAVAELPPQGDFAFENPDAHRELWRGRILDLHPRANEDAKYQTERDPETGVLKSDYGLISIMNGVAPNVHIAILGGLDTTGTQGVTSFALSPKGVSQMEGAMELLVHGKTNGFQVLMKINLEMGYEVLDSRMVALHEIKKTGSSQSGN